ncbi:hypothetical protein WMY93_032018 [Mugilogobius chulae]|uniref:C-type lectin domain-containing protein n=1 Tax=Mugilogobius chulae TaxID=88201 RepID=A0AAW0MGY6_9GOBI
MTYSRLFFYQSVSRGDVQLSTRKNPYEPQPSGQSCEKNLTFRNKCYVEMKNPRAVSFKSAAEECQTVRGTLLTITDQVEQDFITSILATRKDLNYTWVGLKLQPNQQKWVDDSSVSFVNFNPLLHGMVKPISISQFDVESMELCAYMYNDPHSDLMGPGTSLPVEIRNPWPIVNTTQYFGHDPSASLVVQVNRARTPMWIGLFSDDDGAHYRWTDHSHTVYSRWAADAAGGSCVYIDTDGFWKTMECEEELGGACVSQTTGRDHFHTDDVAVKCPHKINGANWIPFKNNCYSLQLVSSRWEQFDKGQARETCKNLQTKRKTSLSGQQLEPFRNLVQFVWLGMFKDENDNQTKWFDGTNVQYNNWKYGRMSVDKPFMAGLNTYGVWFYIINKLYFQDLKQKMIVACKVEKDDKKQYNTSVVDFQQYGSLSYQVLPQKLTWFKALEECGRRAVTWPVSTTCSTTLT